MTETKVKPKPAGKGSREALIQSALGRYREAGMSAVSFRRVAQDIGISHMQPYRFFESKAALLAAMRAQCFREVLGVIQAADPIDVPPLQRLYAITADTFTYLFRRPMDYRLMFALNQPPPTDDAELAASRAAVYQHLRAVVVAGVDSGSLHGDPDDILHLAWAMSHGLFTLHVSGQLMHGRSLDALVQPALDTMFAPFRDSPDLQPLREAAAQAPPISTLEEEDPDDSSQP
ncbi:TetR/AcrR family transcriptional regulator [Algiphilus sp. NNCM1]|uniref:TetR/AcrR family transcriptional regulator n=1 Tax=Algiphilus sp. TaxID=1872431 RepID=UPI001CA6A134|nr:TetR/AcrR family transcriptional regulator [Algiphilus sp.]MBY8966733.1 TetR/AcrR family transcriptional regulator [Algiphilus acroporae]MCI5103418.1 TetR/AcrR family transcriptional regulator [Algiphilus sp.]